MTPILNGNGNSLRSHKHTDAVDRFVDVGGIPTHMMQIGQLGKPEGLKQRFLILIIPGNPGVPEFYEDFMRELYNKSDGQIPVWAIGHAGHTQPPGKSLSLKDVFATDEEKYGLQAQIDHKATFIKEYIPADVKLILIGHSIGCYFILNVLDKLSLHCVHHCYLLFPTIERMATSPNGVELTPVFRYFRYIIIFLAFLFILFPLTIRKTIVEFIYRKTSYPPCMTSAILSTVNPWTVNFSTFLAKIEMNKVTDLQKDVVKKHLGKLSLYYGASDPWCPVQYYNEIIEEFPTLDARVCELNMKHAFVMVKAQGNQMAELVWQWLQLRHLPKSFVDQIRNKEMNGIKE